MREPSSHLKYINALGFHQSTTHPEHPHREQGEKARPRGSREYSNS